MHKLDCERRLVIQKKWSNGKEEKKSVIFRITK